MSVYKYKAQDHNKVLKTGLVEAPTEDVAVEILEERGLSVVAIKEEEKTNQFLQNLQIFNRISAKDLVIFSRQFAVMISANVAVVQALKIMVDQTENIRMRIIISEVADEVDNGSRLSDALSRRPEIFSNFYVSVVRSGEASGKLEEVLIYLADEMEKDYDMMHRVKGAMIYPAFILSGLFVVGIVMMVYVVPKLVGIIQETGSTLPLPTRMLIATSDFLVNYWLYLALAVAGLGVGVKYYIGTSAGREQLDYLLLKVPIFGKLLQKIYLVRFARSMNTLIIGGVSIVNSLKVSSEVISNRVYQNLINETIKEVEEGNFISSVFSRHSLVPKMVSQMINIGEKTGKVDLILEKISTFYTREVDNTISNLMTLIEPFVIVVLGVAVAGMIAAIILPMYNMNV